ncbi:MULTISPECIES: xanthine dehydrogenase accessory protein XdhC [unclassified Marinimicrobium]|uniref:xanthine dehydrogenase accessory protein XdhC n=1 Tax=unclassified Marinimicrobium TaxID=2632100 RepID=UPI00257DA29A|nr:MULTISPECIES: xanthine dehydrogenase accessory protein XdhC [unclassified Marinimicrobium]
MNPRVNWQDAIAYCARQGRGYVIATVISTQGSTPRDGGSKMVIDSERTYDTLGGGQLEFLIVQQAREHLAKNESGQWLKPFPLAAEAAQCCGGNVTVLLESYPASDWTLALFGAGHVSRALTTILGELPCRVEIIDNRPELMTESLPENCHYHYCESPVSRIDALRDDTWVVIFTHDHALDFALCDRLLADYRWAFTGLIGSDTKALRFRKRLAQAGHDNAMIDRLVSPVGLPEVKGKRPMEVAVSIVAQLQSRYYAEARPRPGTSWREIKRLLASPENRSADSTAKEPLK